MSCQRHQPFSFSGSWDWQTQKALPGINRRNIAGGPVQRQSGRASFNSQWGNDHIWAHTRKASLHLSSPHGPASMRTARFNSHQLTKLSHELSITRTFPLNSNVLMSLLRLSFSHVRCVSLFILWNWIAIVSWYLLVHIFTFLFFLLLVCLRQGLK